MSIRKIGGAAFCLLALGAFWAGPARGVATTLEIENEDDVLPAPPATPAPARPNSKPAKADLPPSPAPRTEAKGGKIFFPSGVSGAERKRVRIGEGVGFYYFVRADYAVVNASEVPCVGKVIESGDENISYSIPNRLFLELNPDQPPAHRGDYFIVYRDRLHVEEARSGFEGERVQNLAVVQVLATQGLRCQVEVKQCFELFRAGDKVKPYADEINRWKRAHLKKPLPDHAIRCYVAGGGVGQDFMQKPGYILLTAGSRKGVVEGQTFELNQIKATGLFQNPIIDPCGSAQVIFAGPDCATAQILSNHQSIQKGFEAVYNP